MTHWYEAHDALDYCVMDGECAFENAPKTRVFDCQCTMNEVSGALTIKHECRGRIFKCTRPIHDAVTLCIGKSVIYQVHDALR